MRRTSKKLPKLFEAASLQEAIQILGARKAPAVYSQLVDMAFKIKDETGQIRTNMLREAETNLQKDEKHLSEMIHEEADTEGSGGKESGSGETAQADGRDLDSVAPPGEGSHDASQPAQSQTGTSQLEAPLAEAVDQVADMGSPDPMNTAVIDYIDDGMSKVEASNAAAKDDKFAEAVFRREFKKHMLPILKAVQKTSRMQAEAIRAVDSKIESKPLEVPGFSETVQVPATTAPRPQTSSLDEIPIEETRNTIKSKYLSE